MSKFKCQHLNLIKQMSSYKCNNTNVKLQMSISMLPERVHEPRFRGDHSLSCPIWNCLHVCWFLLLACRQCGSIKSLKILGRHVEVHCQRLRFPSWAYLQIWSVWQECGDVWHLTDGTDPPDRTTNFRRFYGTLYDTLIHVHGMAHKNIMPKIHKH